MPTKTKPSIVFAHGIWADGSSFGKMIPTLHAEGHHLAVALDRGRAGSVKHD
jgi:hypothetical protein